MSVELVEVDHLPQSLKEDKHGRRPWSVKPEAVELVRGLFPMWLRERHGVIVYECRLLDSSSMGSKTFLPRMYDTVEAGMQPAPPRMNTMLASTQETPVDWIAIDGAVAGWSGLPAEDILDRCFYYEDRPTPNATIHELRAYAKRQGFEARSNTRGLVMKAVNDWLNSVTCPRLHLMSGKPWQN